MDKFLVLVSETDLPNLKNTKQFKFIVNPSVCLIPNSCFVSLKNPDRKKFSEDKTLGHYKLDELLKFIDEHSNKYDSRTK